MSTSPAAGAPAVYQAHGFAAVPGHPESEVHEHLRQYLLAFTAAPGSTSHDGLQLLATWAAAAHLDTTPVDALEPNPPVTDTADQA